MNEDFKRLKRWVEECPIEATMRINELEEKIDKRRNYTNSLAYDNERLAIENVQQQIEIERLNDKYAYWKMKYQDLKGEHETLKEKIENDIRELEKELIQSYQSRKDNQMFWAGELSWIGNRIKELER